MPLGFPIAPVEAEARRGTGPGFCGWSNLPLESAVQCGWIVSFPKCVQELLIRDDGGIVLDLDDFGMTGCSGANFFIGRIFPGTAGEAAAD